MPMLLGGKRTEKMKNKKITKKSYIKIEKRQRGTREQIKGVWV